MISDSLYFDTVRLTDIECSVIRQIYYCTKGTHRLIVYWTIVYPRYIIFFNKHNPATKIFNLNNITSINGKY